MAAPVQRFAARDVGLEVTAVPAGDEQGSPAYWPKGCATLHRVVSNRAANGPRYGLAVLVIAATERELVGLDGVVTGVGPVEAGVMSARFLAERRPRAVVHVGLAGSHGFAGPELVIGSEALYCDTDSPLVPGRALPEAALVTAARRAWPEARFCAIGTSARVGGTHGCAVEGMEGFAVLRACELAGVPAVEIRVTSNEIGEPDRGLWRFDEALALLRMRLPALVEALDA